MVIRDPSLAGDYSQSRAQLPDNDFFIQPNEAQPFNVTPSR